uniref:Uncharacterized protein n=1 Tax=Pseudomonas aeruginosa TaxID=287 RepID=A0A7R7YPB7_PSEAI|nr:hypothetical protein [Pseudomonas aeruginosa]
MFNVTLIKGDNQYAAAGYFSNADDYYAKEAPGEWQGIGAELLGLRGLSTRRSWPVCSMESSRMANEWLRPSTRKQAPVAWA